MSSPLVSIMIPTFNQPQYILQAVESALAQQYPNLEVIVSDDSTNEETALLLQPLLANKKLSYYKNPVQLGRVANYRKLLNELATGEWVLMLDGDDYFTDPTYIQNAVNLIREYPDLVLVGAGMKVIHENSGEETFYGLDAPESIFTGKDVFLKYGRVPPHQTDLYPRLLARQINFYRDPSTASDSESLYRLCLRGKVAYIARPVAAWRVHNANTTYTRNLGIQIKELAFIDKINADAQQYLNKTEAAAWRRSMYQSMCTHLLHQAFTAKKYRYVILIVSRFGKYLGWKLSLVYLLRIAGFYKPAVVQGAN